MLPKLLLPAFVVIWFVAACQPGGNTAVSPEPTQEAAIESQPTAPPTKTSVPTNTPEPEPDALAILGQSAAAIGQLNTLTQEQVMLVTSAAITSTLQQDCQYERPSSAYCQIESSLKTADRERPLTNKYEMLFVDGMTYTRQDTRPEWETVPDEAISSKGMINPQDSPFILHPGMVVEADVVGETDVEGADVYEIVALMDSGIITALLGEAAAEMLPDLGSTGIQARLLIGKEDSLPYSQEFTAAFSLQGEAAEWQIIIRNTGFDEPVTIPQP